DGPYIELMAGVYTDNQPDFSWLQPYETKTFSQFWYPVQKIGPAKNANHRAAVNLEVEDGTIKMGVAVTERLAGASLTLTAGENTLMGHTVVLVPGAPFVTEVACPEGVCETDLLLRLCDADGHEVIRYAPREVEIPELPEAKTPPPPPETFESVEELYLTGLHLEQYRHPTIEPEPYWEAALEKDPTDVRCNNAMGLVRFRRGQFAEAAAHFEAAIDKLTRRNPNPRDGEPFYNLGMVLKYQGKLDEAYAAFYKAIWSHAWQAPGYYALAEIDIHRGDMARALDHLERALRANTMNMKARNLKTAVLRHLGRLDDAAAMTCGTVELDPLDMMSRNEAVLISRAQEKPLAAESQLAELTDLMDVPDVLSIFQSYLDMAFDYANAGLWVEAGDVLSRLAAPDAAYVFPTVLYALAYFAHHLEGEDAVQVALARAAEMPTDYCFPVRLEEMAALEYAQSVLPDDAKIAYYLGNLYYDKRRYDEAIANWRRATERDPAFSIPWRNLGIAAYNVLGEPWQAMAYYQKAREAAPDDGRVLSELDQLRRRTGTSPEERLALLEDNLDLVRDRDDLSTELATLFNQTGQPQKALDYMLSRRFHPWEGGTGRISRQYVEAHLQLGRNALEAGDAELALSHFETAQATYPENLGERKHLLWPEADVDYYTGLAKQALGDSEGAAAAFERVLNARGGEASETAYYKAQALRALDRDDEAETVLQQMLERATVRLEEQAKQGFATSVPEFVFSEADMETRRRIHLTYLIGLARLGLGQEDEARAAFEDVLELSPNHPDAWARLQALD
ncbi:MAG: tetratricopeptide repeat protein, partial [Anaerolineae bacterium]|nr:tetratricopeptide repeat protein [Anaerolineae bacterium]